MTDPYFQETPPSSNNGATGTAIEIIPAIIDSSSQIAIKSRPTLPLQLPTSSLEATSQQPSQHHSSDLPSPSPNKKNYATQQPYDTQSNNPILINVLHRIPNTAFGIAMGMAGHAILWKNVIQSTNVFTLTTMTTEEETTTTTITTEQSSPPSSSSTTHPQQNDDIVLIVFHNLSWFSSLVVTFFIIILYVWKIYKHKSFVLQEWKDPNRIHFMNAPHLLLIMLSLGIPEWIFDDHEDNDDDSSSSSSSSSSLFLFQQVMFGIGCCFQVGLTQIIYERWLFDDRSTVSCAQPTFLLSTVGWFLLSNLGLIANIDEQWGINAPQFCFGIGIMLYTMVTFSIFYGLHHKKQLRGSPSLFLLMAPPAVSVISLDILDGDDTTFGVVSSLVLGWISLLFLLLAKIGPQFLRNPGVLGEYWAYVFPLAAVATAWVRYAYVENTMATLIVASIFILIALLSLVCVIVRMTLHSIQCLRGKTQWGDPILNIASSSNVQRSSETTIPSQLSSTSDHVRDNDDAV